MTRRDPIDFPSTSAMLTLVGFVLEQPMVLVDGQLSMRFRCDSSVMVLVTDVNLTELERRGWIAVNENEDEGGVVVTESGCYWARRWADLHLVELQHGRTGPNLTSPMVSLAVKVVTA